MPSTFFFGAMAMTIGFERERIQIILRKRKFQSHPDFLKTN